jgi:hypothetical protein
MTTSAWIMLACAWSVLLYTFARLFIRVLSARGGAEEV